ncbi:MAG: methylated-DNA--[protein]-cysteine S-methyltransferase [Burkholderiaceae bacterium]|nr:methylated-DNA--[protein]-cysteine S-methyltransferase [Burkholderiaceae bacterium]
MLITGEHVAGNAAGAPARFDVVVELPFGWVGVRTEGALVSEISFLQHARSKPAKTGLAQRVVDQLISYCNDSSSSFQLPLAIEGSPFQKQVWSEIARIPTGETRSYGELALQLNASARAVGQACGDNRLPLVIPCHRVVAAAGLGGFAHRRDDSYLRIKRWLLAHEAPRELRLT